MRFILVGIGYQADYRLLNISKVQLSSSKGCDLRPVIRSDFRGVRAFELVRQR